jgi:hypothetical protein
VGTGLINEINSADYVITMPFAQLPNTVTIRDGNLGTRDEVLLAKGFVKREFKTISSPVYELWQRTRLPDPGF